MRNPTDYPEPTGTMRGVLLAFALFVIFPLSLVTWGWAISETWNELITVSFDFSPMTWTQGACARLFVDTLKTHNLGDGDGPHPFEVMAHSIVKTFLFPPILVLFANAASWLLF